MRNKSFGEFIDKKKRESIRQLGLLKNILEHNGFKVESFLNIDADEDPYVFCHSNLRGCGFDGIRIYKIGTDLAFRVQKENKTHPYGSAYSLPIEEMFNDFLTDQGSDQKKAGKMVIEAVAKEIKRFFEKSSKAENDAREEEVENGKNGGDVAIRTTGTDYSALIYNKS